MTMKRIFTAALMLWAACLGSQAQEVRAGVTAGMTMNTPTYFSTFVGYNVGLRVEVATEENSCAIIGLGAMLSDKSWRYEYPDGESYMGLRNPHIKAHPTYLDIPLHAGYRWEVSPKLRVFATAGVTPSIGLFGKEKVSYEGVGTKRATQTLADNIFDNILDNEQERIDVALGYRFGIELNREVQLAVSQDWGLLRIDKSDNGMKIRNRCFTLGLTYMF